MKDPSETIARIIEIIDSALINKCAVMKFNGECPDEFVPLVKKLEELFQKINEIVVFTEELVSGNIDADPPKRHNIYAAPLKELQSRLMSFEWSMSQLMRGNIVSKLNYPGPIFEKYNELIEKVSRIFSSETASDLDWGGTVTSWRYHQLLAAINNLNIMLLETDVNGKILFANPSAKVIFPGETLKSSIENGLQGKALGAYLDSFGTRVQSDGVRAADRLGSPTFHEVYEPSDESWYKITSNVIKLSDGAPVVVHMIDNINEWKSREHQLKLGATIDALTGTFMRAEGEKRLSELLKNPTSQPNCAAFVDLDNLKTINDRFGHTEGDFAIKLSAQVLLENVRETDWVVRIGGDEFIVLFLNCAEEIAKKVVERIDRRLEELSSQSGKPFTVSVSMGLCEITGDMKEPADVINEIDRRMYENKERKKLAGK